MLRYRTGAAGSAAGAAAAAKYFLGETLQPENLALANYYGGETVAAPTNGMDALGAAIAASEVPFTEALNMLITAHGRLFGFPEDIDALDERLGNDLLEAADRAEMRALVASEGGTVARVREDLDPRLADRLGIDMTRAPTQKEVANLLAGARADGAAIEGKQVQRVNAICDRGVWPG